jgi:ubiquinone/menaquinone biosynthesis C-methylase UbiE
MKDDTCDTISQIKDYYRKKASVDRYATSPDFNLREVEIEYISRWLKDDCHVLDVGCGNGFSTLSFATTHKSRFIGVDFVPEMIDSAHMLEKEFNLTGSVDFQVGDVTQLDFQAESFDFVISQRCLLNLPTKEMQWQAMREISRVLRTGGLYLMLEGTLQGLRSLNALRTSFGLSPIPEADPTYNWFSNKFDEEEMMKVAESIFGKIETIQRFGMYYFISRVIHPLLAAPEQPKNDAHINEIARMICKKIPDYDNLGHVALFVFLK